MTSTNDEKEVENSQTASPKGRSYYIKVYKSLDASLTADGSLRERTAAVCNAWSQMHSLCTHSAPTTHPHLLNWLQRHTATAILKTEWRDPTSSSLHELLKTSLEAFISVAQTAAINRNISYEWETVLISRAEWFIGFIPDPWGHEVLRRLLDPGAECDEQDIIQWLKEETGTVFVCRLRQLAVSKQCTDLALSLVTAVMDRKRGANDKEKINDSGGAGTNSFEEQLSQNAGFTTEVWETLGDIEFVLLHKLGKTSNCIQLAKMTPLPTSHKLIERLRTRLDTSPSEKKLWKNSKDVALLIAEVIVTRCMVCAWCPLVGAVLYVSAVAVSRLVAPDQRRPTAAALAAPAHTAHHLHTFARAMESQCSEDMIAFVVELYVRAITAGMNELEKLKLNNDKELESRVYSRTLCSWFQQLSGVVKQSPRLSAECILTAFSVFASPQLYEKLKAQALFPPPLKPQALSPTPSSSFGSWANDSRSQTNFVKTSETLNLKYLTGQTSVLSTAILNEGASIGLGPEMCQDLAVLLSGPRVKTLTWDMDREKLLENCRAYMDRTKCGTRSLKTELLYLNLDPSQYQHLPEEEDDEDDIYYGIEKGYEHLVDLPSPSEKPEEIWTSLQQDAPSSGSEYEIMPSKIRNKLVSSDDDDPLSLDIKVGRKGKKGKGQRKEHSKTVKTKTDKKEKKERKKRDKKSKKPLTLKQIKDNMSKTTVTDSDYDSQGISSMASLTSEANEDNVEFDGLFSMDDLNLSSPKDDIPSLLSVRKDSADKIASKKKPKKPRVTKKREPKPKDTKPKELKQSVIPKGPKLLLCAENEKVRNSINKLLLFRKQRNAAAKTTSVQGESKVGHEDTGSITDKKVQTAPKEQTSLPVNMDASSSAQNSPNIVKDKVLNSTSVIKHSSMPQNVSRQTASNVQTNYVSLAKGESVADYIKRLQAVALGKRMSCESQEISKLSEKSQDTIVKSQQSGFRSQQPPVNSQQSFVPQQQMQQPIARPQQQTVAQQPIAKTQQLQQPLAKAQQHMMSQQQIEQQKMVLQQHIEQQKMVLQQQTVKSQQQSVKSQQQMVIQKQMVCQQPTVKSQQQMVHQQPIIKPQQPIMQPRVDTLYHQQQLLNKFEQHHSSQQQQQQSNIMPQLVAKKPHLTIKAVPKVDPVLNTFSRLSYMHKNKQIHTSTESQFQAFSDELERRISAYKLHKHNMERTITENTSIVPQTNIEPPKLVPIEKPVANEHDLTLRKMLSPTKSLPQNQTVIQKSQIQTNQLVLQQLSKKLSSKHTAKSAQSSLTIEKIVTPTQSNKLPSLTNRTMDESQNEIKDKHNLPNKTGQSPITNKEYYAKLLSNNFFDKLSNSGSKDKNVSPSNQLCRSNTRPHTFVPNKEPAKLQNNDDKVARNEPLQILSDEVVTNIVKNLKGKNKKGSTLQASPSVTQDLMTQNKSKSLVLALNPSHIIITANKQPLNVTNPVVNETKAVKKPAKPRTTTPKTRKQARKPTAKDFSNSYMNYLNKSTYVENQLAQNKNVYAKKNIDDLAEPTYMASNDENKVSEGNWATVLDALRATKTRKDNETVIKMQPKSEVSNIKHTGNVTKLTVNTPTAKVAQQTLPYSNTRKTASQYANSSYHKTNQPRYETHKVKASNLESRAQKYKEDEYALIDELIDEDLLQEINSSDMEKPQCAEKYYQAPKNTHSAANSSNNSQIATSSSNVAQNYMQDNPARNVAPQYVQNASPIDQSNPNLLIATVPITQKVVIVTPNVAQNRVYNLNQKFTPETEMSNLINNYLVNNTPNVIYKQQYVGPIINQLYVRNVIIPQEPVVNYVQPTTSTVVTNLPMASTNCNTNILHSAVIEHTMIPTLESNTPQTDNYACSTNIATDTQADKNKYNIVNQAPHSYIATEKQSDKIIKNSNIVHQIPMTSAKSNFNNFNLRKTLDASCQHDMTEKLTKTETKPAHEVSTPNHSNPIIATSSTANNNKHHAYLVNTNTKNNKPETLTKTNIREAVKNAMDIVKKEERLRAKRVRLLNRKTHHFNTKVIALGYTPLPKVVAQEKVLEKPKKRNKKLEPSLDKKENVKTEPSVKCRRILLRSSNTLHREKITPAKETNVDANNQAYKPKLSVKDSTETNAINQTCDSPKPSVSSKESDLQKDFTSVDKNEPTAEVSELAKQNENTDIPLLLECIEEPFEHIIGYKKSVTQNFAQPSTQKLISPRSRQKHSAPIDNPAKSDVNKIVTKPSIIDTKICHENFAVSKPTPQSNSRSTTQSTNEPTASKTVTNVEKSLKNTNIKIHNTRSHNKPKIQEPIPHKNEPTARTTVTNVDDNNKKSKAEVHRTKSPNDKKNKQKSQNTVSSFNKDLDIKDIIIIKEEMLISQNRNRRQKLFTLKIPNGKTINVRVSGEMDLDTDAVLNDPALKAYIYKCFSDDKQYTLEVKSREDGSSIVKEKLTPDTNLELQQDGLSHVKKEPNPDAINLKPHREDSSNIKENPIVETIILLSDDEEKSDHKEHKESQKKSTSSQPVNITAVKNQEIVQYTCKIDTSTTDNKVEDDASLPINKENSTKINDKLDDSNIVQTCGMKPIEPSTSDVINLELKKDSHTELIKNVDETLIKDKPAVTILNGVSEDKTNELITTGCELLREISVTPDLEDIAVQDTPKKANIENTTSKDELVIPDSFDDLNINRILEMKVKSIEQNINTSSKLKNPFVEQDTPKKANIENTTTSREEVVTPDRLDDLNINQILEMKVKSLEQNTNVYSKLKECVEFKTSDATISNIKRPMEDKITASPAKVNRVANIKPDNLISSHIDPKTKIIATEIKENVQSGHEVKTQMKDKGKSDMSCKTSEQKLIADDIIDTKPFNIHTTFAMPQVTPKVAFLSTDTPNPKSESKAKNVENRKKSIEVIDLVDSSSDDEYFKDNNVIHILKKDLIKDILKNDLIKGVIPSIKPTNEIINLKNKLLEDINPIINETAGKQTTPKHKSDPKLSSKCYIPLIRCDPLVPQYHPVRSNCIQNITNCDDLVVETKEIREISTETENSMNCDMSRSESPSILDLNTDVDIPVNYEKPRTPNAQVTEPASEIVLNLNTNEDILVNDEKPRSGQVSESAPEIVCPSNLEKVLPSVERCLKRKSESLTVNDVEESGVTCKDATPKRLKSNVELSVEAIPIPEVASDLCDENIEDRPVHLVSKTESISSLDNIISDTDLTTTSDAVVSSNKTVCLHSTASNKIEDFLGNVEALAPEIPLEDQPVKCSIGESFAMLSKTVADIDAKKIELADSYNSPESCKEEEKCKEIDKINDSIKEEITNNVVVSTIDSIIAPPTSSNVSRVIICDRSELNDDVDSIPNEANEQKLISNPSESTSDNKTAEQNVSDQIMNEDEVQFPENTHISEYNNQDNSMVDKTEEEKLSNVINVEEVQPKTISDKPFLDEKCNIKVSNEVSEPVTKISGDKNDGDDILDTCNEKSNPMIFKTETPSKENEVPEPVTEVSEDENDGDYKAILIVKTQVKNTELFDVAGNDTVPQESYDKDLPNAAVLVTENGLEIPTGNDLSREIEETLSPETIPSLNEEIDNLSQSSIASSVSIESPSITSSQASSDCIAKEYIVDVNEAEKLSPTGCLTPIDEIPGLVIPGIEFIDPHIGTCYIFRPVCSSENPSPSIGLNLPDDKPIKCDDVNITIDNQEVYEVFEIIDDENERFDNTINIPTKTYSSKSINTRKRPHNVKDVKASSKKYRKGKNIDYPKMTLATINQSNYQNDYKRIIEYIDRVKFSFASPFHREYIDVPELLENWPENCKSNDKLLEEGTTDTSVAILYEEPSSEAKTLDPLNDTTFIEEVENVSLETEIPTIEESDSNFSMGFGERSGRVIQNLNEKDNLTISAATLSDVKQYQPSQCENIDDITRRLKRVQNELANQIMLSKVNQFFNNYKITSNSNSYNVFKQIPGFYETTYMQPILRPVTVNVVQVGQLPVSAAAQNPVTCDPRVTHVSDASPSQCSIESSPQSHENHHTNIKAEYTELTTADLSLPLQNMSTPNEAPDEKPLTKITEGNVIPTHIETETKSAELNDCNTQPTNEKPSTGAPVNKLEYQYETNGNGNNATTSQVNPIVDSTQNMFNVSEAFKEIVTHNNVNTSSNAQSRNENPSTGAPVNNLEYQCEANGIGNNATTSPVNLVVDSTQNIFNVSDQLKEIDSQRKLDSTLEKTDQIAHAMNAAGITTSEIPETTTSQQSFVNIISQKVIPPPLNTLQPNNNYPKSTAINAISLQQALAQILPPPLNQTNNGDGNPQQNITSQVLHIVHGKNTSSNQITLLDNSQQSVLSGANATQVLHIVQNKGPVTSSQNNVSPQQTTFSGLSLVDAGLQQGGNQLLHIVNTGAQKNNNAGQLLKRVNLLTNLTNVQGGNEQKMVQFVCKSADGKSIHLNAPHQRSMVLRLQPIETPMQQPTMKTNEQTDAKQVPTGNTQDATKDDSQDNKSRSIYEENYAKFIQHAGTKPPNSATGEKGTSLPKFNQAFGKALFQDDGQKQNDLNAPSVQNNENNDNRSAENPMNIDHISQIGSPPLLLRKQAVVTSQAQSNLVQQIKQTIAPMNIQTMHGGVIYTRQIPVNLGGGQTINLITVPSTEMVDESGQKQSSEVKFITQNEGEPSIIKIVPQTPAPNAEVSQEDGTAHMVTSEGQSQPQPVLTQMRIKLPMLSKAPLAVPGTRLVRPSFFQIQRNVIGGANQPVYQQLVLTTAPTLGPQTIRLPQAQTRIVKGPTETHTSESQLSSSTLEQLREFDMVLEQVKERSTGQPGASPSYSKSHSTDGTDGASSSSSNHSEQPQQILYSIGNNTMNVAYINKKATVTTSTVNFVRSPDSSVADSPSTTTSQVSHDTHNSNESQVKAARVGSKSVKSRPTKPATHTPSTVNKVSHTMPPKTSTQKPLEDEQTTQRILYILAEYKEQVENSPDKDKPAPRRRTNVPTNPSGSSKRKKSGSRRPGCTRDHSPITGDDASRTMGSEDSSCGTSQGDCTESCSMDALSPQDSPCKVARKLFEPETPAATQPRPQPQRNVIVADGQTITVARSATGKPTTAVLMPANYILPVSMVKGGQQIAIVTNRGPKLLTVGGTGETGAANALFLQRLIGPGGLKPVLARPGVRHVRLPTAALHNLQAFNLATSVPQQQADSTASPASAPTPDLVDARANSSPWTESDAQSDVKMERGSSPEGSEPWNLPSSSDRHDYSYEDSSSAKQSSDRTVLESLQDRYSPDAESQRIFDKMFEVDKKYIVGGHDDLDASHSDCDDKVYNQVVQRKDGSAHSLHRVTHFSAAALRHKYAILEHELRLQKSLSEECEDLGVDSPSASELFPEAELLFAASPADHDGAHHAHTAHPPQSIQPHQDPEINHQLVPRCETHDLADVGLDLDEDGVVTVNEDGLPLALNQEEFARSHPNTTFHSEPGDVGVQPFTLASSVKTRHVTPNIYGAPQTVLMAPATVLDTHARCNPPTHYDIDHISVQSHNNRNINFSSVLVKDDGLTRFDNILTDSRELHLSNTASAIVHPSSNATQVIRRVCYDDDKRDRFLMDDSEIIAGNDAKMTAVGENSRDATLGGLGEVDDDASSPERHAELFWESNSASVESRRPLDFSSDSDKCCKSPSLDETNSTDSSGVGTQMRLDSVIKEARARERSASACSYLDETTHPPIRTYPPKRSFHAEEERSMSGKTRAGESSPDNPEVRRRASSRGVVKRGCHCCNGSPEPSRPKKQRQRKPTLDFTTNN